MRTTSLRRLGLLRQLLYRSGPYLLLEILLPGGTLFALLLFLYRHTQVKARGEYAPRASVAATRVLGTLREEAIFLAPPYAILAPVRVSRNGEA